MMIGIVTRLRQAVCWCNDFDGRCHTCEAADEIEQLQDLCHALYHAIHCSDDNHRIAAERRYWETFRDLP